MDFSKLSRSDVVGAVASLVLVLSLFLLTWYDLSETPGRLAGNADEFLCGAGEFSCTGWETFPILRWLLLLAASAPLILAYIVARGHKLSWAPGELTMVTGFTAFILILYNGFIDPPGNELQEIGVSEQIGYYVALLASIGIAGAGISRAMEASKGPRKTPGTV
ncbi:MAG TPA: hypothetical protein VKA36_03090 [Solirubrobacterales bacterium]|nr:hypothetical protein [Solirubrobacterales bacterium]